MGENNDNEDLFARAERIRREKEARAERIRREQMEALAARDEGRERGGRNADAEWKALMSQLVYQVAQSRPTFTTDDPFEIYDAMPEPKPHTHDKRAMGHVMLRAAREGICKKSEFRGPPSRRKSLHACPKELWVSLIFKGEDAA